VVYQRLKRVLDEQPGGLAIPDEIDGVDVEMLGQRRDRVGPAAGARRTGAAAVNQDDRLTFAGEWP